MVETNGLSKKAVKIYGAFFGAFGFFAIPIIACFCLGIGGDGRSNQGEAEIDSRRKTLYDQVSMVADSDNQRGTTQSEWATVYTLLGKHYDFHTSNPLEDLSIEEMNTYILSR